MGLISEAYRAELMQLHENPHFGIRGGRNARAVLALAARYEIKTVLDYGCGKCGLEAALKDSGLTVINYDPATEFCADPPVADLVVCGDVLEHIEPECLDDVLRHLASKIGNIGYLVVSYREASKTLPSGRNAHLIVQEPIWWLRKIHEFMKVIWSKVNQKNAELVLVVEP